MKKFVLCVILLTLTSCVARQVSVNYLYDDENGKVYQASCNDKYTMGDCYKLAHETCGGDFVVLNKEQNQYAKIHFKTSSPITYNKTKRNILFYCK